MHLNNNARITSTVLLLYFPRSWKYSCNFIYSTTSRIEQTIFLWFWNLFNKSYTAVPVFTFYHWFSVHLFCHFASDKQSISKNVNKYLVFVRNSTVFISPFHKHASVILSLSFSFFFLSPSLSLFFILFYQTQAQFTHAPQSHICANDRSGFHTVHVQQAIETIKNFLKQTIEQNK